MLWPLEPSFDRIRWYGPGPGPTYSDRNFERVGIYQSSLMNDWVDYSRPQENGNKAGVRWLEISDGNGSGLLVQSLDEELLSCNPMPWNPATIRSVDYSWQLPVPKASFLNIDHVQMGVGGDNSWGATPHEQYQPGDGKYSYRYRLSPVD